MNLIQSPTKPLVTAQSRVTSGRLVNTSINQSSTINTEFVVTPSSPVNDIKVTFINMSVSCRTTLTATGGGYMAFKASKSSVQYNDMQFITPIFQGGETMNILIPCEIWCGIQPRLSLETFIPFTSGVIDYAVSLQYEEYFFA